MWTERVKLTHALADRVWAILVTIYRGVIREPLEAAGFCVEMEAWGVEQDVFFNSYYCYYYYLNPDEVVCNLISVIYVVIHVFLHIKKLST